MDRLIPRGRRVESDSRRNRRGQRTPDAERGQVHVGHGARFRIRGHDTREFGLACSRRPDECHDWELRQLSVNLGTLGSSSREDGHRCGDSGRASHGRRVPWPMLTPPESGHGRFRFQRRRSAPEGQQGRHRVHQARDMRLDRWWEGMEPVLGAQEVLQRWARFDVRNAERHEADVVGRCSLDLSRHMTGPVGVVGDDDHHHLDILDGSDDRLAVVGPGQDVPRCDPAADPFSLKFVDDRVGQNPIRRGVAQEDVISHTGASSSTTTTSTMPDRVRRMSTKDSAALMFGSQRRPAGDLVA